MTAQSRTELTWRKSSYSNPDGAACIEVATAPHHPHPRLQTHRRPPPHLLPTPWAAFLPYASSGRR